MLSPRHVVFIAGLGLLGGWLPSAVSAGESNELTRAVSVSRQFIIHAPGRLLPHAIGVFAEQVKREWEATLDLSNRWRDPIILLVKPRSAAQADLASPILGVFPTDAHLKYQITCRRQHPAIPRVAL